MKVLNKYLFVFLCVTAIFSNLNLTKSQEEDHVLEDKKTKLFSCIKLAKIMLQEDKDFLQVAATSYFGKYALRTPFDTVFETTRDQILLTCYTEINLIKSAELMGSPIKHINPFTKENKRLLSPETLQERYKYKKEVFEEVKAEVPEVPEGDAKPADFSEEAKAAAATAAAVAANEEAAKAISEQEKLDAKYIKDKTAMKNLYNNVLIELNPFEEVLATKLDAVFPAEFKKTSTHVSKSKLKPFEREEKEESTSNPEGQAYLDEDSYSNLNLHIFGYDLTSPKVKNTVGLIFFGLLILGLFISYKIVTDVPAAKPKKIRNKKN